MSAPANAQVIDFTEQRLLWDLACLAIRLLKQDPKGLHGMLVAASHGHVHQAFLTQLAESFKLIRVPMGVSEERLTGGLDINETLAQGRRVMQKGLLDTDDGVLLINGAERLETTLSGIIASHIDAFCHNNNTSPAAVIAIDESLIDEPGLADTALGDRLGLLMQLPDLPLQELQYAMNQFSLDDCRANETVSKTGDPSEIGARTGASGESIAAVLLPDAILQELTELAAHLGIASMRALVFASRVARGHALLHGRTEVDIEDATVATRLVLAPRATQLPASATNDEHSDTDEANEQIDESESVDEKSPPDDQDSSAADEAKNESHDLEPTMAEQLLQAAQASLPQHLIADLVRGQKSGNTSGRDSKTNSTGTQGRPAGVRRPRGRSARQRINIIETLKSAVPRQRLRGRTLDADKPERIQVRVEDFRVTRYKQPTRTTTVFVVDASGSAALHRLAEAKGAVELLLAECYVRRDRVAMISFRGTGASLELPPTRSLVRAKRQLSGLPGGGGTPLAAGVDLACDVVRQLKQAGETPVVVFMTDGKANINRQGSGSRREAMEDAESAAHQLAALDVRTLFIDTSPRPRPQAAQLATSMKAHYLPLPPGGATNLPGLLQQ